MTLSLVWFTLEIRGKGMQCQADPYKYGALTAYKATGANLECSCSFDTYKVYPFTYNSSGVTPLIPELVAPQSKAWDRSDLANITITKP